MSGMIPGAAAAMPSGAAVLPGLSVAQACQWPVVPAPDTLIDSAHRRSAAYGLRPDSVADYTPLSRGELAILLERNHALYRHATPVMESLYEQIIHTHHMVVLTDASGAILHTIGDADFMEKADRVALSPGVAWSEQSKGTNAIGTAIAEQSATVIHAGQHYLSANHFLTCSAAPIFDAGGKLLGVLDVTGDQHHFHRHTLGLVRMSAQMIENQLFTSSYQDAVLLHVHSRPEFIGTLMEGLICFRPDGRFLAASRSGLFQTGMSMAALQMHSFQSLFGISIAQLMDQLRRADGGLLALNLFNGIRMHVRASDGGRSRQMISHAADRLTLRETPQSPLQPASAGQSLAALATGDAQIDAVISKLSKVAGKGIPVLLTGETGTGKERFARAIHQASPRHRQAFVALNCAAIPESLIEAELFGYEEGAFTGARKKGQKGKILQAHGGTLFLDEIGDMPLNLQARLLRVLQERAVLPVGAVSTIPVNIEVICATHQPLRQMIADKLFREDLYYRLNGMVVRLPALRERTDLAVVVQRMLAELDAQRIWEISEAVMDEFRRHPWPGNLRQLHSLLRTAMLMADDSSRIEIQHLPDDFWESLPAAQTHTVAAAEMGTASAASAVTQATTVAAAERRLIRDTLAACDGNVSAAARQLGISRNTLYRKLSAESD
ncbi:sigma-54-dependent Fis family transcriptional regulator [Undibacterium luofuense]|nr:sigma-54-dependent Fis family transcriptional regulator [Undibacterium luofuense]